MSEPQIRKKDVPRLAPGTRVSYTACRWWHKTGVGYVDTDPEWWAQPREGTVQAPEAHKGWHYGPDHPWGLKDWETPVLFDKPRYKAWITNQPEAIPTAMLDIIKQDEH